MKTLETLISELQIIYTAMDKTVYLSEKFKSLLKDEYNVKVQIVESFGESVLLDVLLTKVKFKPNRK